MIPENPCPECGQEMIEEFLDADGEITLPRCPNDDCPSNLLPDDIDNDIFSQIENSVQPDAPQLDPLIVIRGSLDNIRWHILNLLKIGELPTAKAHLGDVINLLLPHDRIPPGRPYATLSKKDKLSMRGMALRKYNLEASDSAKDLMHLTLTVFKWLLQTEEELKQDLIEQLHHLVFAIEAEISINKTSPMAEQMLHRARIILLALDKIDRDGSPPVIPT
jgi:hypothetical protein